MKNLSRAEVVRMVENRVGITGYQNTFAPFNGEYPTRIMYGLFDVKTTLVFSYIGKPTRKALDYLRFWNINNRYKIGWNYVLTEFDREHIVSHGMTYVGDRSRNTLYNKSLLSLYHYWQGRWDNAGVVGNQFTSGFPLYVKAPYWREGIHAYLPQENIADTAGIDLRKAKTFWLKEAAKLTRI